MDPPFDRETVVLVAESLANAERYEDALDLMKRVALRNEVVSREERKLMDLAFKKVIGPRKAYWRVLSGLEVTQKMKGKPTEMIKEFREKVGKEINGVAGEMASILTAHVLPLCASPEDKVFYHTVVGDCFTYRAELEKGEEKEKLAEDALAAYQMGTEIAEENLHVADPTRLGLVLQFSVFHRDIRNSVETGRDIAQRGRDAASPELSSLNGQARLDSEIIMTVLSINLGRWARANV